MIGSCMLFGPHDDAPVAMTIDRHPTCHTCTALANPSSTPPAPQVLQQLRESREPIPHRGSSPDLDLLLARLKMLPDSERRAEVSSKRHSRCQPSPPPWPQEPRTSLCPRGTAHLPTWHPSRVAVGRPGGGSARARKPPQARGGDRARAGRAGRPAAGARALSD